MTLWQGLVRSVRFPVNIIPRMLHIGIRLNTSHTKDKRGKYWRADRKVKTLPNAGKHWTQKWCQGVGNSSTYGQRHHYSDKLHSALSLLCRCFPPVRVLKVQLKSEGTRWRREEKWRGNLRMQCVDSTLHTTSEHGVSSITTADAHTWAACSRLNWRPHWFKCSG